MEALWPHYDMYSADEVKRGLARSRFVFVTIAVLMSAAMFIALINGSVPASVAYALGAFQNLFAWIFVSKMHSRVAAAVLVVSNVAIAAFHVVLLQPDSAISIALSIYCINILRACISLQKVSA